MKSDRPSVWTNRVELTPSDVQRVGYRIGQELAFYNGLITSLGGPMRTMASTLKALTNKWADLFGIVAATGTNPQTLNADTLSKIFEPYRDMLFTNGRYSVEPKIQLLLDIAATNPGDINAVVRKIVATEILRRAREQAERMAEAGSGDQVYKTTFETLVTMDAAVKRNLQLPRSVLTVREIVSEGSDEADEIQITLPYSGISTFTLGKPPFDWNMLVLREDGGVWTVELSRNPVGYYLGKSDPFNRGKRRSAR